MKPFDIELAKAGHPVWTRDGKPVRIICYDRKHTEYPIVALVDNGEFEMNIVYTADGKFHNNPKKSEYDLFMATVKREGWVNLYKEDGVTRTHGSHIYPSKESALNARSPINYITTVKIEWEE